MTRAHRPHSHAHKVLRELNRGGERHKQMLAAVAGVPPKALTKPLASLLKSGAVERTKRGVYREKPVFPEPGDPDGS